MTSPQASASSHHAPHSPESAARPPEAAGIHNIATILNFADGTFTLSDPSTPLLRVDDLAPHRGDGIFETVLVTRTEKPGAQEQGADKSRLGIVHNRQPHFRRFKESAQALDLPTPQTELWDAALDATASAFFTHNPAARSVSIRYAMSRGIDGVVDGLPNGWLLTIPIPAKYTQQQLTGVSVVTLDKGLPAYIGHSAPWLLQGAKTLSYAVNQATARVATARGADEALFVSHDGIVLEGPTSNLIAKFGNELVTPDPKAGLLHGTTQQTVFAQAAAHGFDVSYRDIKTEDLSKADALWMVSSVRTAVPIRKLDDHEFAVDTELSAQLREWIISGSADKR